MESIKIADVAASLAWSKVENLAGSPISKLHEMTSLPCGPYFVFISFVELFLWILPSKKEFLKVVNCS